MNRAPLKNPQAVQAALEFMLKVVFLLLGTIACIYGYARFFGTSALEYPVLPFEVVGDNIVRRGDRVPLVVYRCNRNARVLVISTTAKLLNLESSTVYELPEMKINVAPGCNRVMYANDTVPAGAAAGHYILFGDALVPDFLHTHIVAWQSERFEVEAR